MNRRLWASVALVAVTLGGGSIMAGATGKTAPAVAVGRDLAAWVDRTSQGLGWPAVAGMALLAVGGLMATGRLRHRAGHAEPWRTVIQMGRQGRSPSAIAQATGLPQDAVRIALAPVQVESTPRGNSFRSSQPDRSRGRIDNRPGPN